MVPDFGEVSDHMLKIINEEIAYWDRYWGKRSKFHGSTRQIGKNDEQVWKEQRKELPFP